MFATVDLHRARDNVLSKLKPWLWPQCRLRDVGGRNPRAGFFAFTHTDFTRVPKGGGSGLARSSRPSEVVSGWKAAVTNLHLAECAWEAVGEVRFVMESLAMALQSGQERYMKIHLVEGGRLPITRRIHSLVMQFPNGRCRIYEDSALPDEMIFLTGTPTKGKHVGECFPGPFRDTSLWTPPEVKPWPAGRDVVHLALGFVAFTLLNFIVSAAHAAITSM